MYILEWYLHISPMVFQCTFCYHAPKVLVFRKFAVSHSFNVVTRNFRFTSKKNAWLSAALRMNGWEVTTIEKVGTPKAPHPIQSAFVKHSASQCGALTKLRHYSTWKQLENFSAKWWICSLTIEYFCIILSRCPHAACSWGMCTPGMVMSIYGHLAKGGSKDPQEMLVTCEFC